VDRNVIEAAGVDVDRLAQVAHRHRRALDMPSRIAAPPPALPLHQMIRLVEHTEREIVRAFLVERMFQALGGMLLVETLAREPPHAVLPAPLLDVEVDP